jgi:RNA polymerase sigma-70 factor (ECF subfamily)
VHEPDPETVRAAAAGDERALEELVRSFQAPVWRFLRHLLGDATLAEDVAQETFVRMYQRLGSFRHQAKFSTWLLQIARNAGVDALRRRARQLRVVEAAPRPPGGSDPAARAELQAAVGGLKPRLREALLLVEVLGLTYREAATVLRVPEGTAKSRVFTAREQLWQWMAEGSAGEL